MSPSSGHRSGGLLLSLPGDGEEPAGWKHGGVAVRGLAEGNVHHPRLHRLHHGQTHPEHRPPGQPPTLQLSLLLLPDGDRTSVEVLSRPGGLRVEGEVEVTGLVVTILKKAKRLQDCNDKLSVR